MKRITTTIIVLAILLSSCSETADTKDENTETKKTEQVEETSEVEEELIPEGIVVEGDNKLANLSTESVSELCQIVDHFTDMDINYITVDFVTISPATEDIRYEVENDDLTLRTFIVKDEYEDMFMHDIVSVKTIFEKASKNPEMLFVIIAEDGLVSELYEQDEASIGQ